MFGKQAVEGALAVWYWMWGAPVRSGGELAVSAGESAIDNQVDVIQSLADAVGITEAAVTQVTSTLNDTKDRVQQLEFQITTIVNSGSPNETELVAAEDLAIELEALEASIPTLEANLLQAQTNFSSAEKKLRQQERELRKMQIQQQTNEANQRINSALEKATAAMKSVEISGTSTLNKATAAINRRGAEAQGKSNAHDSIGASGRAAEKISAQSRLDRFRK